MIFLHPLKLPSHSPLSCCRTVKDSQEKKIPSSPHNRHIPTPPSNTATFHSDWTPDKSRIGTMWVTPALRQWATQRGKNHLPWPCSLPMTDIAETSFILCYGTRRGLRIPLNTVFPVPTVRTIELELACATKPVSCPLLGIWGLEFAVQRRDIVLVGCRVPVTC